MHIIDTQPHRRINTEKRIYHVACATEEAGGNASFCCLQIHPLLSRISKHFTPTEVKTAGTHASVNNRLLMPPQRHFSACVT